MRMICIMISKIGAVCHDSLVHSRQHHAVQVIISRHQNSQSALLKDQKGARQSDVGRCLFSQHLPRLPVAARDTHPYRRKQGRWQPDPVSILRNTEHGVAVNL